MSDYWAQYEGKSVPLKSLLQWLSDEHDHVTDGEGELLDGWDFPVVNSMALHRWAVKEASEDEYEYNIQRPDGAILYTSWGDKGPTEELLFEVQTGIFADPNYSLVKRRKAGPVEPA